MIYKTPSGHARSAIAAAIQLLMTAKYIVGILLDI